MCVTRSPETPLFSSISRGNKAKIEDAFPCQILESELSFRKGSTNWLCLMLYHVRNKPFYMAGDLVLKETVCCVGGKVKYLSKLSTTRAIK